MLVRPFHQPKMDILGLNISVPLAAVMYSGGIDSTVVIAWLQKQGYQVIPMVFNDQTYNYHHRRKIAMELSTQDLGCYQNMVEIGMYHLEDLRYNDGSFGFVPGWKMAIQIAGMAYCQKLGISEFYTGYNNGNHEGGYGDEDPACIQEVTDLYNKWYNTNIKTLNPFYEKTKGQVIELGNELGVKFELTNGCRHIEHAGLIHCGICTVCCRRKKAFEEAYVNDPTTYADIIYPNYFELNKLAGKVSPEYVWSSPSDYVAIMKNDPTNYYVQSTREQWNEGTDNV